MLQALSAVTSPWRRLLVDLFPSTLNQHRMCALGVARTASLARHCERNGRAEVAGRRQLTKQPVGWCGNWIASSLSLLAMTSAENVQWNDFPHRHAGLDPAIRAGLALTQTSRAVWSLLVSMAAGSQRGPTGS
jgi:hypothetical protein